MDYSENLAFYEPLTSEQWANAINDVMHKGPCSFVDLFLSEFKEATKAIPTTESLLEIGNPNECPFEDLDDHPYLGENGLVKVKVGATAPKEQQFIVEINTSGVRQTITLTKSTFDPLLGLPLFDKYVINQQGGLGQNLKLAHIYSSPAFRNRSNFITEDTTPEVISDQLFELFQLLQQNPYDWQIIPVNKRPIPFTVLFPE
jgi:hypothetical protein